MSGWRWTAIAALTCLALAAAYLPPQPGKSDYSRRWGSFAEKARVDVVNRAYHRTEDLIKQSRFRDSISALLRRSGPQMGDVHVVIRGSLADMSQREFRAAVEQVWRRAGAAPGARLLVLLDVATHRAYWPTYVLPPALDGRTCVASLTLDWNVAWLRRGGRARGTNLQPWLVEALGPCLYYGAFGQPGPQIEAWLQERSFKVANTADWTAAQPTVSVREDPHMWDALVSEMSFDALACTDGRLSRCGNAVKHPFNEEGIALQSRGTIDGVVRRTFWPRNFPVDDHYLAALVHEMGRDRFGQFWRSTASVDSAFAAAFGQPMDQWTAHWARAFVPDLPPFGPAPRLSAVFFGFALAAIAVAAAAAFVTRRQVS